MTTLPVRSLPESPVRSATLVDPETGKHLDPAGAILGIVAELGQRRLVPGSRVMVKAGNSLGYVQVLIALMHCDVSLVLVDHQQTAADTESALRLSGASVIIADDRVALPPAGPTPVWSLPRLLAMARNHKVPASTSLATAVTTSPTVDLRPWMARADAAVLWSSGTSGPAKGVVKPGPAIWDNTRRTLETLSYRPGDVLLPLLPFSHQYGLSLLLVWWQVGCTLLVTPYRWLEDAVRMAVTHGASVVDGPPATFHALMQVLDRRPHLKAGLGDVRMWCVGGAPLPAPLAAEFRAIVGLPLLDGYGSTELGNVALATPENAVGVGRPLPGVEVLVVDDAGRQLPAGTAGELWIRSPGVMAGYLSADGGFLPTDQGAHFQTRDIGYLDGAGNLHVLGRKCAVHRNGYTLYPEGLERKAEACGASVKVIAFEGGRRGASLAFVIADPARRDPAFWRDRLAKVLAGYERPNSVHVMRQWPTTSNGKVDNAALRTLVLADRKRTAASASRTSK